MALIDEKAFAWSVLLETATNPYHVRTVGIEIGRAESSEDVENALALLHQLEAEHPLVGHGHALNIGRCEDGIPASQDLILRH